MVEKIKKQKRVVSEEEQKARQEQSLVKKMFSLGSRAHDKYGNPFVWN